MGISKTLIGQFMRRKHLRAPKEKESAQQTPFIYIYDLPGKGVDGLTMIRGTGFGKGLRPFGVVDAVRIELGFQSDTAALVIVDTTLAGLVQIVTGIELDTGTVGGNCHGPAGIRIPENGAGVAEYFVVVVISSLKPQGFIIFSDIPVDRFALPEIHRRILYRS